MTSDPPFHIAVVDDDTPVREGIALVLERADRRISTYPHGEAFLESLPAAQPDILFLDLKMPGKSGLEVLRSLDGPPFPVVMISAHGDISTAVQALKRGAVNFIEKPFTPESLEQAIEEALVAHRPTGTADIQLDNLTPREKDVALLLNEGLSNKEVAARLGCSPRTVEIHRARIFEKLGVRNVAGLVRQLSGLA